MNAHKLLLFSLQKIYTKSSLHESNLIQSFCLSREVFLNYELTLNAWSTQCYRIFHASCGCNQSVSQFKIDLAFHCGFQTLFLIIV